MGDSFILYESVVGLLLSRCLLYVWIHCNLFIDSFVDGHFTFQFDNSLSKDWMSVGKKSSYINFLFIFFLSLG